MNIGPKCQFSVSLIVITGIGHISRPLVYMSMSGIL